MKVPCIVLVAFLLGMPFACAAEDTKATKDVPKYPDVYVAWNPAPVIQEDVRDVFPHPTMPERVLIAAGDGLMFSEDGGGTWNKCPAASVEKIGRISGICFSTHRLDCFYIATGSSGLWYTEDFGKTVKLLGSSASGMASDSVTAVYVFPGDQLFQTLVAVHGEAAPGMSRSMDGGRTWKVIAKDYFIRSIRFRDIGKYDAYIVASAPASPEVTSIYYAISPEEYWIELVRDVMPTDHAVPIQTGDAVFSIRGGGMIFVAGKTFSRGGPDMEFTSLGITWGPTSDDQLYYAYDPKQMGLVISTNRFETYKAQSRGLFTGDLVKEGAQIRANANGTVFYAVVNGRLSIGHAAGGPFRITSAQINPSVFTYQRDAFGQLMGKVRKDIEVLKQTNHSARAAAELLADVDKLNTSVSSTDHILTAVVEGPSGKPGTVTCNMSQFGSFTKLPLYDDGQHGDGAADDAVYGVQFRLNPWRFGQSREQKQQAIPGIVGVTVTASAEDGSVSGAVAPIGIYDLPENFVFYQRGLHLSGQSLSGSSIKTTNSLPENEAWSAPNYGIRFAIPGGEPWRVSMGGWENQRNLLGYCALSFMVRSDREKSSELFVRIRDNTHYGESRESTAIGVNANQCTGPKKIGPEWQRAVIPMAELLRDVDEFNLMLVGSLIFSGDGAEPVTYWISDITFHVNSAGLEKGPCDPPKRKK